MVYLQLVGLVGLCSVVCIFIVHSIKCIFKHRTNKNKHFIYLFGVHTNKL